MEAEGRPNPIGVFSACPKLVRRRHGKPRPSCFGTDGKMASIGPRVRKGFGSLISSLGGIKRTFGLPAPLGVTEYDFWNWSTKKQRGIFKDRFGLISTNQGWGRVPRTRPKATWRSDGGAIPTSGGAASSGDKGQPQKEQGEWPQETLPSKSTRTSARAGPRNRRSPNRGYNKCKDKESAHDRQNDSLLAVNNGCGKAKSGGTGAIDAQRTLASLRL